MPSDFNLLRETVIAYNRELEALAERDMSEIINSDVIFMEIKNCFDMMDELPTRHQKRMKVLQKYYDTPYQDAFERALSDYNRRIGCFFEVMDNKDCTFCGCHECHKSNLKAYVNYMNKPNL